MSAACEQKSSGEKDNRQERDSGPLDQWLSLHDVCERTKMGPTFIRNEMASGRLKSIRVGRARRIAASDLQNYMRSFNGSGRNENS
jgi:excisionase family DNA binding protein